MKKSNFILIVCLVIAVVCIRLLVYFLYQKKDSIADHVDLLVDSYPDSNITDSEVKPTVQKMIQQFFTSQTILPVCNDTVWCTIEMPKVSYFKFDPPSDSLKWRIAQLQAMSGEQVLLKRSSAVFPNYLDFLDGDSSFRKYNTPIDIFIDEQSRDLSPLKNKLRDKSSSSGSIRRRLSDFKWEKEGKQVVPSAYDFSHARRAPIVKLGYFAFAREGGSLYFEGPQIGEAPMGLSKFLEQWKAVKDEIKTPFIALHSANENWGLLSTYFPNRTIDWGRCCDAYSKDLMDFLDHPMTLMFMVGQHSNISHPKLITLPRGVPLPIHGVHKIIWDTMRLLIEEQPKNQLVFTASSTWGPRPQIINCVSKKFTKEDFTGNTHGDNQKGRMDQKEYYRRLGTSRLGLALSGMGTDTFRLWEALTMGTVPVVEKGFGLDKTLWRLPALLVEDFDQVTPELLRTAYVEALYRANDFEFERLTQSFWWSFIMNVSVTMSSQTVLDKFPLEADDPDFMRPFVPFTCWETNSCGKGTKRIPKTSC